MQGATQRRRPPRETAALLSDTLHAVTPVATVRRRKCGTSPFDKSWLNMDCCGLFCACLTYALHLYGVYTVCFILIPPWMSNYGENGTRSLSVLGHLNRLAFTLVAAFAVAAHFKAMTTDPGAVPPDAHPLPDPSDVENAGESGDAKPPIIIHPTQKGKRLCRRCNAFKPQRAHHCSVCRRCIIKMDHHCPWVNNCVGIGNHKYFLLFVFYTFLSCLYSLGLIVLRFAVCMRLHSGRKHVHCLDEPTHLLNILGLLVEAILFGLFTTCMMVDQFDVIFSKITHIDRLKGSSDSGSGGGSSSLAGVAEVFGAGRKGVLTPMHFRMDWLSPFAQVCFPASVRDDIMGFCQPCLNLNNSDSTVELTGPVRMVRNPSDLV